jgi:hypothetical protein
MLRNTDDDTSEMEGQTCGTCQICIIVSASYCSRSDAGSYPAENDSTRLWTRLLRLISCMLVVGIYIYAWHQASGTYVIILEIWSRSCTLHTALNRAIYILLVGCPCIATAYNNTYINYPLKKSRFLLIVSVLRIIFFYLANLCYCLLNPICLRTTRPMK